MLIYIDTHFTPDIYKSIYSEWGSECFLSYGSANSRGTAIFISNSTDYKIHNSVAESNGNFCAIDISVNEYRFTLLSLYGPNIDSPSFFTDIFETIERLENDSFIICGDFNLVIDPAVDYYNYKNINNPKARNKVLELINCYNLVDPFRHLNQSKKRFAWRRTNPIQQARLDLF